MEAECLGARIGWKFMKERGKTMQDGCLGSWLPPSRGKHRAVRVLKIQKCRKHALPQAFHGLLCCALLNKIQLGRDLQDCKFTSVFQKWNHCGTETSTLLLSVPLKMVFLLVLLDTRENVASQHLLRWRTAQFRGTFRVSFADVEFKKFMGSELQFWVRSAMGISSTFYGRPARPPVHSLAGCWQAWVPEVSTFYSSRRSLKHWPNKSQTILSLSVKQPEKWKEYGFTNMLETLNPSSAALWEWP